MTNGPATIQSPEPVATGVHGGIDAAGMSNVGRSRSGNEDAFLIATLQRSLLVHDSSPRKAAAATVGLSGTLLMVADGMGGEGGGDVASCMAVNTVASYLLNLMPWTAALATFDEPGAADLEGSLTSALVVGDAHVRLAAAHSATPRMGTTLTMALVFWPTLYLAHVGDTRCYLLRAGQFSRLTTDHTMAQKVTEATAEPIDPASELHHVLWNSLGGNESLPEPQIVKLKLEVNDRLLFCSDGLTKHVSDQQILATLAVGPNMVVCERLIALANDAGGSDNVTVLVADARAFQLTPAAS
jgi:serine/threonine protein phosphatase PrpC